MLLLALLFLYCAYLVVFCIHLYPVCFRQRNTTVNNNMWKCLKCSQNQLNLKILLVCGQSFRWRQQTQQPNVWVGVLNKKLWFLRQESDGIYFQTKSNNKNTDNEKDDEKFLFSYFQLDVDVPKLYKQWISVDQNFSNLKNQFSGICMLKQDPVENLFSFICSQNNNIIRITQLVGKLCESFGEMIIEDEGIKYYTFPTVSKLSESGVEEKLRKLSFGYRAKFIYKTAKTIEETHGGEDWLYNLIEKPYEEAHKELCSLPGVGAKVADCVCLMSLDKTEAIPVDTHMWQIAVRDYLPHLKKNKTVTDKAYKEIGNYFRELYGKYAGWAHSVLFSADLKKFQELKEKTIKVKTKAKRKIEKQTVCVKKKKT